MILSWKDKNVGDNIMQILEIIAAKSSNTILGVLESNYMTQTPYKVCGD